MEMCLRVLKESNKSRFDSYSRQEQCIDHIPYYLSGLSGTQFMEKASLGYQALLKNAFAWAGPICRKTFSDVGR